MRVDEHTITLDGSPVFYRSADEAEGAADGAVAETEAAPPTLYLHGAPTSSDDWVPFLERSGGIAPDLIGFGRSGKGAHLDYSPEGLAGFVERFLEALGIERFRLAGHDWGAAVGLLVAEEDPDRVERMVLIDAIPLLDGFRWHRVARLARRPLVAELAIGSVTRSMLARWLRSGTVRPEAWPDAAVAAVWDQFDQGTQRALLRLHRSAREPHLAELGASLPQLDMPSLIVWGERDPWLSPEFADGYAARLPRATVDVVADAGHWPWLDEPEVIATVTSFLAAT